MMLWFYQMFARIRAFFFRSELDRQVKEELATHIELLTEENVRSGMDPERARREALLKIGSREAAMELHRDTRGFPFLEHFIQDTRHGARLLGRNPLFALTAALSLAVGIAADTTVFTVANSLLFRLPAGVAEPGRLVDVSRTQTGTFGVFPILYSDYLEIRRRATTLEDVYHYGQEPRAMSMGVGASTESIFGNQVSPNYFTVLGARPAAGRLFGQDDGEKSAANPVMALSYSFWTRRFHKDPAIVGQTLQLNSRPFRVVGVAADGFQGTNILSTDVWIPAGSMQSGPAALREDVIPGLVGGRLKPGVSVSQAAAEMNAIGLALASDYPARNRATGLRLTALSPIPGNLVLAVAGIFSLLMGFVSLVLVIACANIAGVLLARSTARRREIAVRLAMGAGRARLVRQLLTETMMLFIMGGLAGLLLSRLLTSLVISLLPAGTPLNLSLGLDGRVIVFTIGLSLIAALLSGLAPALHASKADVVSTLKDDAQNFSGRARLRNAFVVSQVALSIVLVVAAGLFAAALQRVSSVNPGYDPHGVEVALLDLNLAGYTNATGPLFARDLADRVRLLPGIEQATMAALMPTAAGRITFALREAGSEAPPPDRERPETFWNVVEPGYFSTMRIPLIAGRDFSAADRAGAAAVAIVSEKAARKFYPGEDAVGKYLPLDIGGPGGRNGMRKLVIGVVGNVQPLSGPGVSSPLVYLPLQQQYFPRLTIAARTSGGQRIAGEIRALVASMDPKLPVLTSQTLEEDTASLLMPQRVSAAVTGSLGMVGLFLAAVGVYGVTAYAVTRRTREIGIRIALGAQRDQIVRLVLRQGMSLVAMGSAIGLVLAAVANRLMSRSVLYVPAGDLLTFSGATVLVALVGLAACYVPVRRATRINAMEALRHE